MTKWLEFLLPWEFSFFTVLFFSAMLLLYLRGLTITNKQNKKSDLRASGAQQFSFFLGLLLAYAVLHTRFDYYAQYMFFMHRLQHLVLHHLAPFLIALSAPWQVIWAGFPSWIQTILLKSQCNRPIQFLYRVLQQPLVAMVLFVGLIYLWLNPFIHFYAMLSLPLYHLMNWSMWIDGLLFWWLILNSQQQGVAVVAYSWRILVLILVMVPQIYLGAHITFAQNILYDVYAVCGRAWPLAAETDQQIGGLITWIPATMMSIVGVLILLHYIFKSKT